MAEWIRESDGSPVLDTSNLKLNKSKRLLGTDLGQQLMRQPRCSEWDLAKMVKALNESCGDGKPLTLAVKQEIREFLEELQRTVKEN